MRIFIALLLSLSLELVHADSSTVNYPQQLGRSMPPYSWIDQKTGKADGFTRYLLETLAKDLGLSVQFYPFDIKINNLYEAYTDAANTGVIDLFSYVNPTSKIPSSLYRIQNPLFNIQVSLFISDEHSKTVRQWSDLKPLKGGYFKIDKTSLIGNSEKFDRYADTELMLETYPSNLSSVQAFIRGDIDYLVGVLAPIKAMIKYQAPQLNYHVFPEPLASSPVNLYVAKRSPLIKHISRMEELLKEYQQSGYSQLLMNRAMAQYLNYRLNLGTE